MVMETERRPGDWPLDVIIDLVAHMRRSDLLRTAEILEDAALTFVEENPHPIVHRPELRVISGRQD